MEMAIDIAVAQRPRAAVMLISDLDDDPNDLPALTAVGAVAQHDRVPIRIVGLSPSPADVAYFRTRLRAQRADRRGADARAGRPAGADAVPVDARRARGGGRRRARAARGLGAAAALEAVAVTALRLAAIAVLAAVAVVAALLAADVRAWPVALESGDAVYAIAPERAQVDPRNESRRPLQDAAGDRRRRRGAPGAPGLSRGGEPPAAAEQRAPGPDPAAGGDRRVRAVRRTRRIRRWPRRRGRCSGSWPSPRLRPGGGVSPTDTAIADFTDAVRVEPGDTAAKFDLELLLRLTAPNGQAARNGACQRLRQNRASARRAACPAAASDDLPDAARSACGAGRRSSHSAPRLHGRTRVAAVARRLGLDPPRRWSLGSRSAAAAAAVALLGLAAAQPALTDEALVRERTDVAALFVLDTSRSMAASLHADLADAPGPSDHGGGAAARRDSRGARGSGDLHRPRPARPAAGGRCRGLRRGRASGRSRSKIRRRARRPCAPRTTRPSTTSRPATTSSRVSRAA